MKNKLVLLMFLSGIHFVQAQGSFVNLGFESAAVPNLPLNQSGGFVSISAAFPGWTTRVGTDQISQALHNDYSLGGSIPSILGPTSHPSVIIDGNYTALLVAGSPTDISLSQTGLVPEDAQSLMFKAISGNGPFNVSLAGSLIPVMALETTSAYTLYGGDIATFAGLTGELRFTAVSIFSQGGGLNVFYLDSIQFSTQSIPEPSVYSLLGYGVLLFGTARMLLKKKQ